MIYSTFTKKRQEVKGHFVLPVRILKSMLDWFVCLLVLEAEDEEDEGGFAVNGLL